MASLFPHNRALQLFALVVGICLLESRSHADDRFWTSLSQGQHGSWFASGNWSGFALPDADDRAVFDPDDLIPYESPQNISLDNTELVPGDVATIRSLEVRGSAAFAPGTWRLVFGGPSGGAGGLISQHVNVINGELQLLGLGNVNTPNTGKASVVSNVVTVGDDSTGALLVASGARLTAGNPNAMPVGAVTLQVGRNANGNGVLVIQDVGSFVHVPHFLVVGTDSSGRIEVANGGQLYVEFLGALGGFGPSANGTIEVHGLDSEFEMVGQLWMRDGANRIVVSNRGSLITHDFVGIGTASASIDPLSTNEILIEGGGSTWMASTGFVRIGDGIRGKLTVRQGAHANVPALIAGQNGRADVDVHGFGDGSTTEMTVGNTTVGVNSGANGSLSIHALARYSTSFTNVADQLGSQGRIDVYDRGIFSSNGSLLLGSRGLGVMAIESQGKVSVLSSYVGALAGSNGQATVSGIGSEWNTEGTVFVGDEGLGTLTVDTGGSVRNASAFVGAAVQGVGTAMVTGNGSTWSTSGTLVIANRGQGSLNIQDQARVTSATAYVGSEVNSTGHVSVSGNTSSWTNSGSLFVGNQGSGTLQIEGGGLVVAGSVAIGTAGGSGSVSLRGNTSVLSTIGSGNVVIGPTGELNGDGRVVAAMVSNGGLVIPGDPTGALRITGNFSQSGDGVLQIGLASPSMFGQLHISGNATVTGDLDVDLLGFMPTLGNSFRVLTAASVSGSFSSINLPSLSSGLAWDVNYQPTFVELAIITSGLLCDLNGDAAADAADAGIMFGNWGDAGVGDCNGDGIVDGADAGLFFSEWTGDADSPLHASVPEPAVGISLVAAGMIALFGRRSVHPLVGQAEFVRLGSTGSAYH